MHGLRATRSVLRRQARLRSSASALRLDVGVSILPDPGKVKPPRDEDGRITHWVEGMDKCSCGGKHLYRDCDKDKGAPKDTSNVLEQLSAEDVKSLIGAYLNGQVTEKFAGACEIEPSEPSDTSEWCAATTHARTRQALALPRLP